MNCQEIYNLALLKEAEEKTYNKFKIRPDIDYLASSEFNEDEKIFMGKGGWSKISDWSHADAQKYYKMYANEFAKSPQKTEHATNAILKRLEKPDVIEKKTSKDPIPHTDENGALTQEYIDSILADSDPYYKPIPTPKELSKEELQSERKAKRYERFQNLIDLLVSPEEQDKNNEIQSAIFRAIQKIVNSELTQKMKQNWENDQYDFEKLKEHINQAQTKNTYSQKAKAWLFGLISPTIIKYYHKYVSFQKDTKTSTHCKTPEEWVDVVWETLVKEPSFNKDRDDAVYSNPLHGKSNKEFLWRVTREELLALDVKKVLNLDLEMVSTQHGILSYFDLKKSNATNANDLLNFFRKICGYFLMSLGIKENRLRYTTVSETDDQGNIIKKRKLVQKLDELSDELSTEVKDGETQVNRSDLSQVEDWESRGRQSQSQARFELLDDFISANGKSLFIEKKLPQLIRLIDLIQEDPDLPYKQGNELPEALKSNNIDQSLLVQWMGGIPGQIEEFFDFLAKTSKKDLIKQIENQKNELLKKKSFKENQELLSKMAYLREMARRARDIEDPNSSKSSERFMEIFERILKEDVKEVKNHKGNTEKVLSDTDPKVRKLNNTIWTPINWSTSLHFKSLSTTDVLYIWLRNKSVSPNNIFFPEDCLINAGDTRDPKKIYPELDKFRNYFVMIGMKPSTAMFLNDNLWHLIYHTFSKKLEGLGTLFKSDFDKLDAVTAREAMEKIDYYRDHPEERNIDPKSNNITGKKKEPPIKDKSKFNPFADGSQSSIQQPSPKFNPFADGSQSEVKKTPPLSKLDDSDEILNFI